MPRKTKKTRRKPVKTNDAAVPVKTNGAAVPPAPATIDYDAAVVEGKEIVEDIAAKLASAQDRRMRLGELADAVEKAYGEGRLTKYAKDIGAALCTLKRSRSVYRAWAENEAAPPLLPKSFAVAQDLQRHPRRFEIIKKDPDITTRKARTLRRTASGA